MANPFLMAILNLSHGAVLKEKGPKHVLGKYLRPSSHPWLPKFAPQRPVSQFGYETFFLAQSGFCKKYAQIGIFRKLLE